MTTNEKIFKAIDEAKSGKYALTEVETGKTIVYGENTRDNDLIENMVFVYMFPEYYIGKGKYTWEKYQIKLIKPSKKKFKVEIVETYRRYIEVEAEDEDTAYNDINNQIMEGLIDLPCDGKDYKYDRELFVLEIKE